MPRLLLFDVDMTLLWSGGAGTKAMNLAFQELFGLPDGFANVEFSGRTDRAICLDALRLHVIEGDHEALLERFKQRYQRLLPETLRRTEGHLMPGIGDLLEALGHRDGVRLGLATGNFRRGAELKLAHYGIDRFFLDGGFGDDSEDRAELVRAAIERLADGVSPRDVLVIGDTPHDVASARANGAVAVAVATGPHSQEELTRCGADLVFPSFADWQKAAAILLGET